MASLDEMRDQLVEQLRGLGTCAVAPSGGVDSAVVAKAACLALEQNAVGISTLFDQSTEGITIFLPSDPFTANYVSRGELTEEQISTINTPSSGGSDIRAEISLLETTASPDGTTIRIGISIQNYGGSEGGEIIGSR